MKQDDRVRTKATTTKLKRIEQDWIDDRRLDRALHSWTNSTAIRKRHRHDDDHRG